MPYIKPIDRFIIDDAVLETLGHVKTPGELNFTFTRFIKEYVELKGLSYQTINDVIGALEGAKLEFYRRIAVPYENGKMAENGDVY